MKTISASIVLAALVLSAGINFQFLLNNNYELTKGPQNTILISDKVTGSIKTCNIVPADWPKEKESFESGSKLICWHKDGTFQDMR